MLGGLWPLQIFYFIFYNIGIFLSIFKGYMKKKGFDPPPTHTHAQKKALIKKSSNHSKKKRV